LIRSRDLRTTPAPSTMARNRKEKEPKIKLKQPDRSGPDPTQQTLLDLAQQRGLLNDLQGNDGGPPADEEALVGRLGESILWSMSLTVAHFTLDVLVANQYAVELEWPTLISRTLQAFPSKPSFHLRPPLFPPFRGLLNTADQTISQYSNPPPILHLPLPHLAFPFPAPPPTSNPTPPPPAPLLHRSRLRRQLPYPHHEQLWLLCCHEESTANGYTVDLVRD
jgi:hypothetical protein